MPATPKAKLSLEYRVSFINYIYGNCTIKPCTLHSQDIPPNTVQFKSILTVLQTSLLHFDWDKGAQLTH